MVNAIQQVGDPGQHLFVTLTYPGVWPESAAAWKLHLRALYARLERAYGPRAMVWKLEPQRRGAPHYHLIVFGLGAGSLNEFRRWVSTAWYEVVGSGDPRHLAAGTNACRARSWNGVVSYASKYLSKGGSFVNQQTGEVLPVGRFWGVFGRALLPIGWVVRLLALDQVLALRESIVAWMRVHDPAGADRVLNGSPSPARWTCYLPPGALAAMLDGLTAERLRLEQALS